MLDLVRLLLRSSSVRLFTCNWRYLFFLSLSLSPPPSTHILNRKSNNSLVVTAVRGITGVVSPLLSKKKSLSDGLKGSQARWCFQVLFTLRLVTFADFLSQSPMHHLMCPWKLKRQATKWSAPSPRKKKNEFLCIWTFVEMFGRLQKSDITKASSFFAEVANQTPALCRTCNNTFICNFLVRDLRQPIVFFAS